MVTARSGRKVRNAESAFIARGGMWGDYHQVAPWCMSPIPILVRTDRKVGLPTIHQMGRVDPVTGEVKGGGTVAQYPELGLQVACRRCEGCAKHKKRLWVSRAYQETIRSFRTWFGTLTFPPAIHAEMLAEAMSSVWADGVDYHSLSDAQQQAVEASTLYVFVDRFWKRLRKAGYRFRYLCVAEPHENGLVHFHVLIHEITPHPIPKARLEDQWQTGLSHWRLVDTGDKRAVFYVCKYLGKEGARPRSSLHYGQAVSLTGPRAKRAPQKEPTQVSDQVTASGTETGNRQPLETKD